MSSSSNDTATMPLSASKIPLTLIVATTLENGIGKNGALPWPMLKKEMAYFARVTKRVPSNLLIPTSNEISATEDGERQAPRNAVIMGRKTWSSIPPKFRPLKDRVNVVISSRGRGEIEGAGEDVIVAGSITQGLQSLVEQRGAGLGKVFVIGGARVYGDALGLEQTRGVLITKVRGEWECDVFFPELEKLEGWVRREKGKLEEEVGERVEGVMEEGGVEFEFGFWERV